MPIRTDRLILPPGLMHILQAELRGRAALASELGVIVPPSWPPSLYDEDAVRWALGRLSSDSRFEEWGFRYFVLATDKGNTAVGAGGFKGPPSDGGSVEIGYSILPEYQGLGLATEAAAGLVRYALQNASISSVVAETLPELTPSIRVLVKNGFRLAGGGSEPGVVRYEIRRPDDADGGV